MRTRLRRSPSAGHTTLDRAHQGQVDRRRAAAVRLVGPGTAAADRIASAPPAYLLSHDPSDVARHCALLTPIPPAGRVYTVMTPGLASREWRLDVAARDHPGLLAAFSGVLANAGIDVDQAVLATWDDGAALEAFVIRADRTPRPDDLHVNFEAALGRPLASPPVPDAEIAFDRAESPLYTPCEVRAADRHGLLSAIALAIASCGADVHAARVTTIGGIAHDHFDLSDRTGRKLTAAMKADISAAIVRGVGTRRTRGQTAVVEPV